MPISTERSAALELTQLGVESVLGQAVPANRRFLCTSFATDPSMPTTPYRPSGFKVSTTATQGKESTALAINGALCFDDLIYLYSSLFKTATPTTPSGATNTRRWVFKPSANSADNFQSYTVQVGTSARAEQVSGVVVNNLTHRWTQTDATLTGQAMGQKLAEGATITASPTDIAANPVDPKSVSVYIGAAYTTSEQQTVTITGTPTGGTFALTFEGQTTAPIAYNAIASVVQTALQALTNLGDNVTVSGGPGPATPWVVTFGGIFTGVDATLMTADGTGLTGGTPVIAVTDTTPGGMTKLTRLMSCELAIPDMYGFGYTLNDADPSWSFVVEQGVDPRCTIVVEHDSAAAAFMNNWRNRDTLFCRILARGADIEAGFPRALQLDFPFKFIENSRQDTNSVYTSTFTLALMYSSSFNGGGWLQATVDSSLSAL